MSLGLQLALQVSFPKGASLPSSLPDGEKTQEELGWFPELLGNQSARNPGPDPGPQDSGWVRMTHLPSTPEGTSACCLLGMWHLCPRFRPTLSSLGGVNALGPAYRGPTSSPTSWLPHPKLIKQMPANSTLINKNLFSASLSSSPQGPPPVTTLPITPSCLPRSELMKSNREFTAF